MKKNVILLILLIFITSNLSFAADFYPEMGMDPFFSSLNPEYVPHDEEQESIVDFFKNKKNNKEKEIQEEKQEITVEPVQNEEPKPKEETFVTKKRVTVRELEKEEKERNKEKITIKDRLSLFKKKEEPKQEEVVVEDPKVELSADYMEYFPDRYEVEAVGNAKIEFTKENTIITAHRIIFNYDRNTLKANENVVLISSDSVTEGDFIKLDLNKPDGWIENPVTKTDDIKLSAKEAFVYSDRIEEYDGVAKILRNDVIGFRARSFASVVDHGGVLNNTGSKKNSNSGVYKLKADTIYIDSKQDHEVITIKNADLYLKNYKLGSIPSARIVSNKQNNVIESNFPEMGSQSLLGLHAGPAVVLNVPGGSTLKLSPIVTYSKEKLGIGGIARYRNQTNMTEIAYGTSRDEILIRGRQKIMPGLMFYYSRLTNQNEWFLGYRKPEYSANLVYSRSDYVKDLKLTFAQQYSAGLFKDYHPDIEIGGVDGRFRWMTQTFKPIYSYKNEEGNIKFSTGLVAQTAASVYTTGDVLGLVRFGPTISTQVGPWTQSLMYFQSAQAGQSPFIFDSYRYGRNNIVLIETLRVCKYLSLGYLASLAMDRDKNIPYSDDLFQENRFFVSVGPDYARVSLGYDAYRQNTTIIFSMLVGTKDSEIAFKKSVLKNPQQVGKKSPKKKAVKKDYSKYLNEAP